MINVVVEKRKAFGLLTCLYDKQHKSKQTYLFLRSEKNNTTWTSCLQPDLSSHFSFHDITDIADIALTAHLSPLTAVIIELLSTILSITRIERIMSASSQVINPNSVQSQFQALASHKTKLDNQIRQANAERLTETQKFNSIRASHLNIMERMRVASSNVGVEEKKRQVFSKEVRRLESNLKEDQNALKAASLGVEQLQKLQTQSKYQFVKEMENVNEEMGDALRRFEECGLEALLNVDTCLVLKQFLENKVNCQPQGTINDIEKSNWVKLLHNISSMVERLESLTGMCEEEKGKNVELFDKADGFRNAVQQQNNEALGDEELVSLEKLWEASTEFDENLNDMIENGVATNDQPTHMQLIYDGHTPVESNGDDYDMEQ